MGLLDDVICEELVEAEEVVEATVGSCCNTGSGFFLLLNSFAKALVFFVVMGTGRGATSGFDEAAASGKAGSRAALGAGDGVRRLCALDKRSGHAGAIGVVGEYCVRSGLGGMTGSMRQKGRSLTALAAHVFHISSLTRCVDIARLTRRIQRNRTSSMSSITVSSLTFAFTFFALPIELFHTTVHRSMSCTSRARPS